MTDEFVFAAEERRGKSRRIFNRLIKSLLIPLIMLMSLALGLLMAGGSRLYLAGFLIWGVLFSWLTVHILKERRCSWFAIRTNGLECGTRDYCELIPYTEIELLRCSYLENPSPFVEVNSRGKSYRMHLERDETIECGRAILSRSPCAVWIDQEGIAHPPPALRHDPTEEIRRIALQNMDRMSQRFRAGIGRYVGLTTMLLAVMVAIILGLVGVIRTPAAQNAGLWAGLGVATFFAAASLYDTLKKGRVLREWRKLRDNFAQGSTAELLKSPTPNSGKASGDDPPPRTTTLESDFLFEIPIKNHIIIHVLHALLLFGLLWPIFVGFLQFSIVPSWTNYDRAYLALFLASPIAILIGTRRFLREYRRVECRMGCLELIAPGNRAVIPVTDVIGIVGVGGISLDGGELVNWKGIVILTWFSRHVVGFPPEENSQLFRELRLCSPHAWALPFRGEIEAPLRTRRVAGADKNSLGRIVAEYRRQFARLASFGVSLATITAAIIFAITFAPRAGETFDTLFAWVCVLLFTSFLLLFEAFRAWRVIRVFKSR